MDATIRSLADVPILSRNKRGGAVEEILPIVKIEDRETARGLFSVAGRCVNDKVALIAKEARAKLFVFAEIRSAHGAIFTNRPMGKRKPRTKFAFKKRRNRPLMA
jgi:hypothetical protein